MGKEVDEKRELSGLKEGLRSAFSTIKEELDDHLDSINQNSTDVQECYDLLNELELKLNKVTERLDNLEYGSKKQDNPLSAVKLTPREQEVFMTLYLNKNMSPKDIAKKLSFTEGKVQMYLINLIGKGIPILKELSGDLLVFSLSPDFKEMQARRKILPVNVRLVRQSVLQNF